MPSPLTHRRDCLQYPARALARPLTKTPLSLQDFFSLQHSASAPRYAAFSFTASVHLYIVAIMHSCIATLLSILAILSPALGILTANDLPYHDPQSPQTPVESCLRRYHNYDAAYGKLPYQTVFFRHPDESHFELAILTAYIEFYPHTLKAWLEERNFTIRDFSDSTDSDLCGWREYESVVVSGRRHGQIGWRRNNLYLNAGASQSSNSTSVEGASGSYISHIDPIKPSHDTVEVVKNILLNNTP